MFKDPIAAKKFTELVKRLKPQVIVETGTFMGDGTFHIAEHGIPTVTIEVNKDTRDEALANFARAGFDIQHIGGKYNEVRVTKSYAMMEFNIRSFLGSSPDVINHIIASLPKPALYYLDAHWEKEWPILWELEIIKRGGHTDCGIIIHDFQVPGKDFGFDTYEGQPLNYDFVKEKLTALNPDFDVFYNEEATQGPGYRGILYAFPKPGLVLAPPVQKPDCFEGVSPHAQQSLGSGESISGVDFTQSIQEQLQSAYGTNPPIFH